MGEAMIINHYRKFDRDIFQVDSEDGYVRCGELTGLANELTLDGIMTSISICDAFMITGPKKVVLLKKEKEVCKECGE